VTASFAEEPGEYRWRLRRVGDDRLWVRIIELSQTFSRRPDEEGKIIFDAVCRLRTFAGAVLSMSQRVLEEYSFEGYREKWGSADFPVEQQQELGRLLIETRAKA
jgi:hypothetical protein